jgi:hypothetical protein
MAQRQAKQRRSGQGKLDALFRAGIDGVLVDLPLRWDKSFPGRCQGNRPTI